MIRRLQRFFHRTPKRELRQEIDVLVEALNKLHRLVLDLQGENAHLRVELNKDTKDETELCR
jgi:hypothetical protein